MNNYVIVQKEPYGVDDMVLMVIPSNKESNNIEENVEVYII